MPSSRIYLDHNASAPLLPEARAAVLSALELGNPSSVHREGKAARRAVEDARAAVSALAGQPAERVVFTSGATEAASLLLTPHWRMGRSPISVGHLFVCAADHPCLLGGGRFPADQTTQIGVDRHGLLRLDTLAEALDGHDPAGGPPMVAVHCANNETGVVQPLEDIAALVTKAGGLLVIDGAQMAGRADLAATAQQADFLILSAHKIGGPKGVGAIVTRSDVMMPGPLATGGGQERGFRPGTENVAGIAGFGAAAAAVSDWSNRAARMLALRERIEDAIRSVAPAAAIHGAGAPRLPNTVFFSAPGLKAETMQIAFDLAGFAVSAGSACSSGRVGPSHVLKAMGVDRPEGALRVSVGPETSEADVDAFAAEFAAIAARSMRTIAA